MNTQYNHPYKDHAEPFKWAEDKQDEIDELYEWYVSEWNF